MNSILKQIQDGSYAKEFMNEMNNGGEHFKTLRNKSQTHLIEQIGSEIRSSFTWGRNHKLINRDKN